MITDRDVIPSMIAQAVHKEIERAIDDELSEASKRLEGRIRSNIGGIAAKILERFSMERIGPELVIRVNFENTKTQ